MVGRMMVCQVPPHQQMLSMNPTQDHPMEEQHCWPFELPTADQFSVWMSTNKYMIDDISSSQGFISRVEHKTREIAERFIQYVIARCDGLPADKHQSAPLISEHLHLGYQPQMYPPYEKPDQLVLDLDNEPYTAYARAVLSTGITMTLHETEVFCYPVEESVSLKKR